jgi:hypothetical protein
LGLSQYLEALLVIDDKLAEPFDSMLYERSSRSPQAHCRSRPPQTANGAPTDAVRGTETIAALLDRVLHDEGSSKASMVELRGLEPLTPCLPGKCSTS